MVSYVQQRRSRRGEAPRTSGRTSNAAARAASADMPGRVMEVAMTGAGLGKLFDPRVPRGKRGMLGTILHVLFG